MPRLPGPITTNGEMSAEYTYRRKLRATDLMPAVAVGLSLGIAGFYVARVLLQRASVFPRSAASRALVRTRPPQPPALVRSG
jgi:hypothetical protein